MDTSVIIICYNQEATVARAIESVLSQDYGDMEVVVSDDCSTDGTRRIVADYARRGLVRDVSPRRHLGIPANYFHALSCCRGRYIADCAGDDAWTDPARLSRLRALMTPGVTVAIGSWMEGARIVRPFPSPGIYPGPDSLPGFIAHTRRLHLSAALYLRRAIDPVDTWVMRKSFGCEDMPIMCRLLSRGSIACDGTTVLDYTVSGTSITRPASRRRAAAYYSRSLLCTVAMGYRYGCLRSALPYALRLAIHILRTVVGGIKK